MLASLHDLMRPDTASQGKPGKPKEPRLTIETAESWPSSKAWIYCAAIAVGALLAGCGSSEPIGQKCEKFHAGPAYLACINREISGEPQPSSSSSVQTTASPPSTEEPGGPLSYVGTITGSGNGTTVSNRYSLGPPLYSKEGTPPEEALRACLVSGQAAIDSSVFARGQLTLTYEKGSLPLKITAGAEYVRSEGSLAALTALQIEGHWHCTAEELDNISLELQPGERQTFPFWIVFEGVLNNAHPRLPGTAFTGVYFGFMGGLYGKMEVQGPGRGKCPGAYGEEWQLLIYNRSGRC